MDYLPGQVCMFYTVRDVLLTCSFAQMLPLSYEGRIYTWLLCQNMKVKMLLDVNIYYFFSLLIQYKINLYCFKVAVRAFLSCLYISFNSFISLISLNSIFFFFFMFTITWVFTNTLICYLKEDSDILGNKLIWFLARIWVKRSIPLLCQTFKYKATPISCLA